MLQANTCGHALDDLQQMRGWKENHWVIFDKSIQEPKEIFHCVGIIDEIIICWEDLQRGFY